MSRPDSPSEPPKHDSTDLHVEGAIATITFNRPAARNAMTWKMYEQLVQACDAVDADQNVRAVILRGAGGKAFVAGTDIAQFLAFESGRDGIDYEAAVGRFVGRLQAVSKPCIAVIEGWAVGGGLALANACDIRIAASGARFGVPIARTLGNLLSAASLASLVKNLGPVMVRRMVLLAEMIDADEMSRCGYVHQVVEPQGLDDAVAQVVQQLVSLAPLTLSATKQLLNRLDEGDQTDHDLVEQIYGSADFAEGVAAFTQKRPPQWGGR